MLRMAPTRSGNDPAKRRHALFDNGVAAFAFGAVCLMLPLLLGRSPALGRIAQIMWFPAAVGLGIGVILLALHLFGRRHPRDQARSASACGQQAGIAQPERHPSDWTADALEHMAPVRFEAVCEILFSQAGFMTRSQPDPAGSGADICLYSKHAKGPAAIVRCKHELDGPIGVEELCAFYAVMISRQIKRGTYVTNARFTHDARQFGRANGVNLMDGEQLLALIASRTPEQRKELLSAGYERAQAVTAPGTRNSR